MGELIETNCVTRYRLTLANAGREGERRLAARAPSVLAQGSPASQTLYIL